MKKPPPFQSASESLHDKRTALVREMVAKENAETEAKTARLKALRLAREAAEPPPPPAPKRGPKPKPKKAG
jgi:hypothetical protein